VSGALDLRGTWPAQSLMLTRRPDMGEFLTQQISTLTKARIERQSGSL
jgi:hypothetical protein